MTFDIPRFSGGKFPIVPKDIVKLVSKYTVPIRDPSLYSSTFMVTMYSPNASSEKINCPLLVLISMLSIGTNPE